MSQEHYMSLSDDQRAELMKRSSLVQEKLAESFRQYRELEKSIKEQVKNLEKDTADSVTTPYFEELLHRYRRYLQLIKYLKDLRQDLLDHFTIIVKQDESNPWNFLRSSDRRNLLRRYQVNLLVDNSEQNHAPVIFESNPTFSNLFGQIEYESEFGVLATDFSKSKPAPFIRLMEDTWFCICMIWPRFLCLGYLEKGAQKSGNTGRNHECMLAL